MAYNGYRSWAQWNVSLWINNDEGLYNMARAHARRKCREYAAACILDELHELGITHTPDGARYTKTAILASIRGM